MDAQKLGSFIATQRKELGLTQADLAEKLHVTDKAISRWERGLGLPDINTIEPLSVALNVSVVEVMKSELLTEAITEQDTSNVIKDVINLLEKKRAERRKICVYCGVIALLLSLILLIDNIGFLGFVGVFLTTFGFVGGVALTIYSIYRKKRKLPYKTTFIIGLLLLLIPIIFVCLMVMGFLMGGGPT
ncbi:MAG: helix-turn-helix transcriptional regulator [Acutalibacteraceae bacterium]|nr:helix-turn-helix transcriptional regulator [Acutalibacteraceae bacterium]